MKLVKLFSCMMIIIFTTVSLTIQTSAELGIKADVMEANNSIKILPDQKYNEYRSFSLEKDVIVKKTSQISQTYKVSSNASKISIQMKAKNKKNYK